MKQPYQYMVIDDDNTSNIICNFVIQKFYSAAVINLYNTPEKALEYIDLQNNEASGRETILFLDVNMPTMTGFEFLKEFSKLEEVVKEQYNIYMLTSSIEDFSIEAKKFPMVKGFLSKPLKISHLEKIHLELQES